MKARKKIIKSIRCGSMVFVLFLMSMLIAVKTDGKSFKPKSIKLNVTTKTLKAGQSYKIKVKSSKPEKASKKVKWKITNNYIAKILKCNSTSVTIYSIKPGVTRLIATSKIKKSVKAVCAIKVLKSSDTDIYDNSIDESNKDKPKTSDKPVYSKIPLKQSDADVTYEPIVTPTKVPVTVSTNEPSIMPSKQPVASEKPAITENEPYLTYEGHVQGIGWMSAVKSGEVSGTTGQRKRIEAIKINLADEKGKSAINYRAYIQDSGWLDWVSSGQTAGSEGMYKRMEAIQIKLGNQYSDKYDIYYSVHLTKFGWLGWAKNGEKAGSEHLSLRMEAIKIAIVKKGTYFDVGGKHFIEKPEIKYRAHVRTIGWTDYVTDCCVAGTTGEARRLEAIEICLSDYNGANGIEYQAHCSGIGWQDWKKSGEIAGTTGEARQLEAVKIKLTGELSNYFDIYYRVHVAKIGWLGWASNGEIAGTTGGKRQAEAIEIMFAYKGAEVDKGGAAYQELTMESPSVNQQASENVLNINWNNLNQIGKQASGSVSCSVFALAYCRTILDGTPKHWSLYNEYGNTQYNVKCIWDWGQYNMNNDWNENTVYKNVVSNIDAGKPVILRVTGRCPEHYVTVVGYTNVTDLNNLSNNNFIIMDSGHLNGRGIELENMGACPFTLLSENNGYTYITSY